MSPGLFRTRRDVAGALHGWTCQEALFIGHNVFKAGIVQHLFGAVEIQRGQPGADGHVGDGIFAHDPVFAFQRAVQHVQDTFAFVDVTLTRAGILNLGTSEFGEEAQLTKHRAQAPIWNISHCSVSARLAGSVDRNLPDFSAR